MANTMFMDKKYSVDDLVSHYLDDLKALRSVVKTAADETKLLTLVQAVNTFKGVTIKDLVQLIMSYGRTATGKGAQMRAAFPLIVGYRGGDLGEFDIAYTQLLLAYAKAFKDKRENLKEWMLKFLISSRFSPFLNWVDQEIDRVIQNAAQKIQGRTR